MDTPEYLFAAILILLILLCVTFLMVRHELIPSPIHDKNGNSGAREELINLPQLIHKASRGLGKTYALIIGANQYVDPIFPHLDFVKKDAETLAQVLRQTYTLESVRLFTGKDATTENIRKYLKVLSKITSKDDAVFFYFAGHAWTQKINKDIRVSYLCTDNTRFDNLVNTAISFNEIKDLLSNIITSRTLFILDACVPEKMLSSVDYDVLDELQATYPSLLSHNNEALITVSKPSDIPRTIIKETDDYRSIFTSYLIEALEGGTVARQNIVRVRNLFFYIRKRLTEEHPGKEPNLFQLEPGEDFPIFEMDAVVNTP